MLTTNKFAGFENIYQVEGPYDDGATFFAKFEESGINDIALERADWVPEMPLVARWSFGPSVPGDIVSACFLGVFLISQRVRQVLQNRNVTGWSTYPVSLFDKEGRKCHGFLGLSITGRCGAIDETRGELIKPHPQFPEYRGVYFDELTWDGSDFFIAGEGGGYIFVTDAVKQAFEEHSILGFRFTPLTEAIRMELGDDIEDERDDEEFLSSLFMDHELDSAGFVTPTGDPPSPEVPIEYHVIYPFDNKIGKKWRTFDTFDNAKAFVLHLQSQHVQDVVILRSHQVIWASPSAREKGIEEK